MTWNQSFLRDYWGVYSFRRDTALALRYMHMDMRGEVMHLALPQLDYLLARVNERGYQGNLYLFGGFGAAHLAKQNHAAGLAGVEADIESRRYFALASYEGIFLSKSQNDVHRATARLGIAPYEAEFNELTSWLMVQFQWHPALVKRMAVTPLARFFYKNVLWEMGVSFEGDWMINLMFHF